jgi:hypothetical protein
LMLRIDKRYIGHPWMGSSSLADQLNTPKPPLGVTACGS